LAKQELVSTKKTKLISKNEKPMIEINKSWQQMTVKYLALEGGFYGLVSENGARLLPMNLSEKYKIAGTIIRVKGHPLNNMMTIQQWGQPFEITDIELIKMGNGKLPTH